MEFLWWEIVIPAGTITFLFIVASFFFAYAAKKERGTIGKIFLVFCALFLLWVATDLFVQYGKDMYGVGYSTGYNEGHGWTRNPDGSWSKTIEFQIEIVPAEEPEKNSSEYF